MIISSSVQVPLQMILIARERQNRNSLQSLQQIFEVQYNRSLWRRAACLMKYYPVEDETKTSLHRQNMLCNTSWNLDYQCLVDWDQLLGRRSSRKGSG